MDTPRFRFSVMPCLLALLVGVATLPATNVVRVDARGLGHEHAQPWRLKLSAGLAGLARAALTGLTGCRQAWLTLARHPWMRPATAVAATVLLVALDRELLWATSLIIGATLTEGQHAGEFILGERPGVGAPSRETITVLSGQNLKAGAVIGRVNKGVGRCSTPTVVGTGNGTMSQVFAGPEVQKGSYVVTCTAAAAHGGTFSVVNPSGKALPNLVLTAGAGNTTVYRSREINFSITDGSTDFVATDAFTIVVDTTAPVVIGTGNGTISGLSLGPDAKPGQYRVECITAVTNGGTFKVVGPDGDEIAVGSIVAGAGGTLVLADQRQLNLTITDGSTDFAVGDAFNVAVFNELAGGKVVAWDPTTFDGRDDVAGVLYDNVDASAADLAGVILARDAEVMKSLLQWGAAITAAQKESAYGDLAARGIVAR